MNPRVDKYIAGLSQPHRGWATQLRQIIRKAAPKADEEFKWSTPWYLQDGWLCYFSSHKNHITLGFARGVRLKDPLNLFEGAGKSLRHVKIREARDIRPKSFSAWVKEATAINAAIKKDRNKK